MNIVRVLVVAVLASLFAEAAAAATITTFAGGGPDDVAALSASLGQPVALATDAAGNLFIVGFVSRHVYRVDAAGWLTRFAGTGYFGSGPDGGLATATDIRPVGVAVEPSGNVLISDSASHRIRRVDAATRVITTIAGNGSFEATGDGGPAVAAGLGGIFSLAVDALGNVFAATADGRLRRVDGTTGVITTVTAQLESPTSVAVDRDGTVYVTEANLHRVRRIHAATGAVVAFAGTGVPGFSGDGGPAATATLQHPNGIAVDAAGNVLIADGSNRRIRRVDRATGMITTVAGTGASGVTGDGGPATSATFDMPIAVHVDGAGHIFIADVGSQRVRRIDATTGTIATVAGNGARSSSGDGGSATNASMSPLAVAPRPDGSVVVVDAPNRVRMVDPATGVIATIAGNGSTGFAGAGDSGPAVNALLNAPQSVISDADGNVYISDTGDGRVRRIDALTGTITTAVGGSLDGMRCCAPASGVPATSVWLFDPTGLAFDASGNLYVAEGGLGRVLRRDRTTSLLTSVAGGGTNAPGDGGPATAAALQRPIALAFNSSGDLYIAESINHRVRRVDGVTGTITTVAGTGVQGFSGDGGAATSAQLSAPAGVAVDAGGNVFVADRGNIRVRRIDAATGIITTAVGGGAFGTGGGDGGEPTDAVLSAPFGLAFAADGDLYIADSQNRRVRRVSFRSVTTTTALTSTPNPSVYGEAIEMVAEVTSIDGAVAEGDVVFSSDGTALAGPVAVDGAGRARLATASLAAGSHAIVAEYTGTPRYLPSSAAVPQVVQRATPVMTWPAPVDIVFGTALGSAQLNATLDTSGTLAYSVAPGTLLDAGMDQLLTVTFTPADTANYSTVTLTVTIDVLKADQTITFGAIADRHVSETPLTLLATSTSGLPVDFAVVNGPATVTGDSLTLTGTGVVTVRASQSGNGNYNAATPVDRAFQVFNTATGDGVTASPGSGTTLTFTTVTTAGDTTVTVSSAGPPPPSGFRVTPPPPTYYDITTTAVFGGPVTVCIAYDPTLPNSANFRLLHHESGAWLDVTTSNDTVTGVICGEVTSLSPFLIVEAAPEANAGADQAVDEAASVTLDGSATIAYRPRLMWAQIAGPTVVLSDPATAQPSFVAPQLAGGFGTQTLTFQLTVTDSGVTSIDTVDVTVKNVNHAPVADGGAAQAVNEGALVTLSAVNSYDPDGDAVRYDWSQIDGPLVALSDASAPTASFVAPILSGGIAGSATLTFEVRVTDGEQTDTARVVVTVEQVNHIPVANAGEPQTVRGGKLVTLNGLASHDPDGDVLEYRWTQVGGPAVTLDAPTTATPTFTTPFVAMPMSLVFRLTVTDSLLESEPRDVVVTVVNQSPVCTAGRAVPSQLWPPDHKLVPIDIVGVTDPDNASITVRVTGVTQDEPVDGLGDGDTSPDAMVQGDRVLLRAERARPGNGRVYHVHFSADDGEGGTCAGTVTVGVPASMKPGASVIDDGPFYDSTTP